MTTVTEITGSEPVTLAEAKSYLYITSTDYDTLLTSLISVARETAEGITWTQIIPATLTLELNEFPDEIELRNPVISVTSIEYVDSNGDSQTLSSDEYRVSANTGMIQPVDSWPATKEQYNAVTVTYSAGYDASELRLTVPEKIRQAILFMVTHWFNNREMVMISEGRSVDVKEVPFTAELLLGMESQRTFS